MRGRTFVSGFITNLAYGLMLCGATVIPAIVVLEASMSGVWLGILFLVPLLINWLIREYCRNFTLFTCLHILLAAAVSCAVFLIFGNSGIFFAALVFMIISFIFSFSLKLSKTALELTVGMILATAGLYVLAGLLVTKLAEIRLYGLYAVFTAVIFLLYMLKTQMSGLDTTLDAVGRSGARHMESVRRLNNRITALFLAAAALLMLAFSGLPIASAIRAFLGLLQKGLLLLLRFVLSLFTGGADTDAAVTEVAIPTNEPVDLSDLMGDYEAAEPLLSDEAFQAIMYGALIIVLLAVAIYFIRNMRRRLGRDSGGDGEEEFYPDESRERVESLRRRFSLFGPYLGEGNRGKVRKLFYKRVRVYHKKRRLTVKPSETACDIIGRIQNGENDDISALGTLYNKARYGGGEISGEDLAGLRK